MTSNFVEKLKESGISVAPVMVIVLVLHYTIAPLPPGQIAQFICGGILLILGLGVFLVGADLGISAFGQRVGASLAYRRSLILILVAVFSIGFAITIAEPNIQVLVGLVTDVAPSIHKTTLLVMIAVGVALFLTLGALRIVFQIPLRILLFCFYGLVFSLCVFVPPGFVGIAFDAGGSATGPVTVPFIMAMGIGMAGTTKKKEGDDSSFGLVGIAGAGPVAVVAVMGLFFSGNMDAIESDAAVTGTSTLVSHFLGIFPGVINDILTAILPMAILFTIFQVVLFHLPAQQVRRIGFGFFYTFIGLVLFMTGVNGGLVTAGRSLGLSLGGLAGGWALFPIGLLLGAVIVCAEPAVWVLNEQVETISGGSIKRSMMLASLSVSIALAVSVSMVRVITGMSIWWVLFPGYMLALVLTRYCPPLFTAIAFDSGCVASGPMSTAFILSLTLGASFAMGGNPTTDAFGLVALITLAPLITVQVMGLIFNHKGKQQPEAKS
ncbi:DUF1538 domain-containing protein [Desulfosarcina sp. OttesenSCG-928-A07]|nr:DUF1538 domain-containing protein [Desulfosarcina sp. OttesenSCG-928-G17]MDL2330193.1 DUF1538 domain-containing protein [Desulfosarcina sp. OttesenSCG-928-A07]